MQVEHVVVDEAALQRGIDHLGLGRLFALQFEQDHLGLAVLVGGDHQVLHILAVGGIGEALVERGGGVGGQRNAVLAVDLGIHQLVAVLHGVARFAAKADVHHVLGNDGGVADVVVQGQLEARPRLVALHLVLRGVLFGIVRGAHVLLHGLSEADGLIGLVRGLDPGVAVGVDLGGIGEALAVGHDRHHLGAIAQILGRGGFDGFLLLRRRPGFLRFPGFLGPGFLRFPGFLGFLGFLGPGALRFRAVRLQTGRFSLRIRSVGCSLCLGVLRRFSGRLGRSGLYGGVRLGLQLFTRRDQQPGPPGFLRLVRGVAVLGQLLGIHLGKGVQLRATVRAVVSGFGEDVVSLVEGLAIVGHVPSLGRHLGREGHLGGSGGLRRRHRERVRRRPVHIPAVGKHARHGPEYEKYDHRGDQTPAILFAHASHAGLHGCGLLRGIIILPHIRQYLPMVTVISTIIIISAPGARKRQQRLNREKLLMKS